MLFVLYALHCKEGSRRGKVDEEERRGEGGGKSSTSADGGREGAGAGWEGAKYLAPKVSGSPPGHGKIGQMGKMGENWGKWGKTGENGGKWGKMGICCKYITRPGFGDQIQSFMGSRIPQFMPPLMTTLGLSAMLLILLRGGRKKVRAGRGGEGA